jgi:hypothetical protein
MSLASKIANAIKPTDVEDAEVAQALDAVEAARKLQINLETKAVKTATLQSGKRTALAEAALDAEVSGDLTKYKRIEADLGLLDTDAERLDQAQSAAAARLLAAEQNLHAMGVASHVKTARRLTTASMKAATGLVEHLEGYAKDFQKLIEVRDRIIASWPNGVPPQGAILFPKEIVAAIEQELCRILPRDPLSQEPGLPGSKFNSFVNPFTLKPLLAELEAANSHLIALVERGPAN